MRPPQTLEKDGNPNRQARWNNLLADNIIININNIFIKDNQSSVLAYVIILVNAVISIFKNSKICFRSE